jgi:hypothetical protein
MARRKEGNEPWVPFVFSFLMRLFMLPLKFRRYASAAKSRACVAPAQQVIILWRERAESERKKKIF